MTVLVPPFVGTGGPGVGTSQGHLHVLSSSERGAGCGLVSRPLWFPRSGRLLKSRESLPTRYGKIFH